MGQPVKALILYPASRSLLTRMRLGKAQGSQVLLLTKLGTISSPNPKIELPSKPM